jgi:hypothetical protein
MGHFSTYEPAEGAFQGKEVREVREVLRTDEPPVSPST